MTALRKYLPHQLIVPHQSNDVLGAIERKWQRGLAAAKAFSLEHGHLRVPQKYIGSSGYELGKWLGRCRINYAKKRLSRDRIDALNALGMVWDVRANDWFQGLALAQAYFRNHGHLFVPQKYVTPNGFKLGSWINRNRANFAKGLLDRDQIAKLDALNMSWHCLDEGWRRGLSAARLHHERHGHINAPLDYVDDAGFKLGHWLSNRRSDRLKGKLPPDRIAALDLMGMRWRKVAGGHRSGSTAYLVGIRSGM